MKIKETDKFRFSKLQHSNTTMCVVKRKNGPIVRKLTGEMYQTNTFHSCSSGYTNTSIWSKTNQQPTSVDNSTILDYKFSRSSLAPNGKQWDKTFCK